MIDFDPGTVPPESVWLRKTLADLRAEALAAATGIAFEALRAPSGERIALVVCITGMAQISRISAAFDFVDDGRQEDWNTLTLADLFVRTAPSRAISFECSRNAARICALVLSAADPCSCTKLAALFEIPI